MTMHELGENVKELFDDEVLDRLGLTYKTSAGFGVLGASAAALLIGVGIGMLLAPKTGRELRDAAYRRLRREATQVPSPH